MSRSYAAAWIVVSTLFVAPASAQPGDAPVRAAVEKLFSAINDGDVFAAAELWRADAVSINISGLISGKVQIDERLTTETKLGVKFGHRIDRIDVDGQSPGPPRRIR